MAQISSKLTDPLFKNLTDRQKAVLIGRFGLGNGGEKETLEAIGQKFDITRERVRQIESSALSAVAANTKSFATAQAILRESKRVLAASGGAVDAGQVFAGTACESGASGGEGAAGPPPEVPPVA